MPMTLEQKKEVAEDLSRVLEDAKTVYLTDFTGLDVDAMTELRNRLRERGVGYRVAKNTLMRRALEDLDYPDLEEFLHGPTGLVLGGEDPIVAAKVVRQFAEEHENRPSVKAGVVDRRTVSAEEIAQLAELPTREELLASIMGSLTAPVAGVVGVLEGLIRDIAHMAHEVAKQREAAED